MKNDYIDQWKCYCSRTNHRMNEQWDGGTQWANGTFYLFYDRNKLKLTIKILFRFVSSRDESANTINFDFIFFFLSIKWCGKCVINLIFYFKFCFQVSENHPSILYRESCDRMANNIEIGDDPVSTMHIAQCIYILWKYFFNFLFFEYIYILLYFHRKICGRLTLNTYSHIRMPTGKRFPNCKYLLWTNMYNVKICVVQNSIKHFIVRSITKFTTKCARIIIVEVENQSKYDWNEMQNATFHPKQSNKATNQEEATENGGTISASASAWA